MKVFLKIVILFLFAGLFSAKAFAQGSPEKFSREFLNAFINYNEEKLKYFVPSDPSEQAIVLGKLKEIYTKQVKPMKTPTLTSEIKAVLKDGNEKYKQISDVTITISPDQKVKYELVLWGCYVKEGKWMVGEKIEFNKILQL